MPTVYVTGSFNMDLLLQTSRLPGPGETVLADNAVRALGGKGANQAVAARRSGADVVFVCKLGRDMFGKTARAGLRAEGLPPRGLMSDAKYDTGIGVVARNSSGENQILVAPGANMALTWQQVEPALKSLRQGDLLMLQLEIPLVTNLRAATFARKRGARVLLNPAPAVPMRVLSKLLRHVDIVIPNQVEAAHLTGIPAETREGCEKAAAALRRKGPEIVVITRGAKGAFALGDDLRMTVDRAQAGRVVDTVGAGDAFCGAFAAELLRSQSLAGALRFANAAAAISVTRRGAMPSVPQRQAVLRLLASPSGGRVSVRR